MPKLVSSETKLCQPNVSDGSADRGPRMHNQCRRSISPYGTLPKLTCLRTIHRGVLQSTVNAEHNIPSKRPGKGLKHLPWGVELFIRTQVYCIIRDKLLFPMEDVFFWLKAIVFNRRLQHSSVCVHICLAPTINEAFGHHHIRYSLHWQLYGEFSTKSLPRD